jgi:hypothetical protein
MPSSSSVRVDRARLLAAMRTRAMNARMLAFVADVPRRAVHRALEQGEATASVAERIGEALGVSVEEFTR